MTRKGIRMVRSAVLVCGLSVAAAGVAMAQDQAPPPPPQGQMGPPAGGGPRGGMMDPSRRADRMKHELNLNDDQTAQVKAILEDGRTKMEALRSNSSAQGDRRSQMMSIRKAEEDKIEALLTPDQKTKYAAMQAQMRDRRGGPGGPPAGDTAPPPPPPPPQS